MKGVFEGDWRNIFDHFLLTERPGLLYDIKLVEHQSVS